MATPWENRQISGVYHRLLKRFALPVREYICSFPNLRERTAFVFAVLPWVARSQVVLCIDNDLVRDHLPRVIQIYPRWGIDRNRIVIQFRKLNLI